MHADRYDYLLKWVGWIRGHFLIATYFYKELPFFFGGGGGEEGVQQNHIAQSFFILFLLNVIKTCFRHAPACC